MTRELFWNSGDSNTKVVLPSGIALVAASDRTRAYGTMFPRTTVDNACVIAKPEFSSVPKYECNSSRNGRRQVGALVPMMQL